MASFFMKSKICPIFFPGGKGILRVSSQLSYETVSEYDLQIMTYELGDPPLSSMANVKVTVLNDLV